MNRESELGTAKCARRIEAATDYCCGVTDVGRIREINEDEFHVSADGRLVIVADGMGGHEAGEVASRLAVETIVRCLSAERRQALQRGTTDVGRALAEAVDAAHRQVRDKSCDGHAGMGATVLVALILGDELYTCHVGDVRCYVRTRSGFDQITRDHSVIADLVRQGHLTPEQARRHPHKNEVLQAIGMPQKLVPELNQRTLEDGDCIVVCSDGLWEALRDDEISSLLNWEGSVRQRAIQLVDRANDAGGPDNITVVLYEHVHAEDSTQ
jgi:protein phosphatase